MSDEEDTLYLSKIPINKKKKLLKVFEGSGGRKGVRLNDLTLIACFGGDKLGGLKAALERAGQDKVELRLLIVQDGGKLEAVLLAFLIERALLVEQGIGAAGSGAGVAKNKQIHSLFTL